MLIAITGATGFIGRYIVAQLAASGHRCRLWCRQGSDRRGFDVVDSHIEWVQGELGDSPSAYRLVEGCDAVVHAALDRPGTAFRGAEGPLLTFVERNVLGTLQLIEESRAAGVGRFVFISTCAVHERILNDRPLDETHPLWPTTHYGAHKAALEKFVHSYGFGAGYDICALRPTGIYGLAVPPEQSKWFALVRDVLDDKTVECHRGGKEVHAADVARAVEILLAASGIAGQAYACYDRYVTDYEVATLAKRISGSSGDIRGEPTSPKHQIVVDKLGALGMRFGGDPLLEHTVAQLVEAVRPRSGQAQ
jgi:nucleoside-diphosphate-sugar epimerase